MVTWNFVSWRVALITIYDITPLGQCILPFRPQPSNVHLEHNPFVSWDPPVLMSLGPGQHHSQITCGLRFMQQPVHLNIVSWSSAFKFSGFWLVWNRGSGITATRQRYVWDFPLPRGRWHIPAFHGLP